MRCQYILRLASILVMVGAFRIAGCRCEWFKGGGWIKDAVVEDQATGCVAPHDYLFFDS